MATLDLTGIYKQFGSVTAVHDVNFQVQDGEFMCILGPSGCGKSTLLRMVAGFEMPTSGDIRIDSESVTALSANRRPTAMVFQKYTLWPHMKVSENIAFGLQLRRLPRAVIEQKVKESLALVSLSGYEDRYPAQLSGGQQQRVALARALVLEPKILLLDEPFSSLDAILRVRLREELRRIQRRLKITAIFVTHDQEEALTLADRIAVMNAGHIEQLAAPSEIYASPSSLFVADFIGAMNLIPGTVSGGRLMLGALPVDAPAGLSDGPVTVAIRPEDLVVLDAPQASAWSMTVEQISDLGYYRRAILEMPGMQSLKIFLPKALEAQERGTLHVYARRYLVYRDGNAPQEVVRGLPVSAA
ncbi:MAG: ABC transporter ATP-binding protein [Pleurocapsa minor GSE-CHR-MK-17-07R]|jgi:putative spermidine/putrescine transport system ATP-binding protein|nr:ABC transporter ATP-binding protein [Pleurocapsa minor GSE-CHR-MK 17-07R]